MRKPTILLGIVALAVVLAVLVGLKVSSRTRTVESGAGQTPKTTSSPRHKTLDVKPQKASPPRQIDENLSEPVKVLAGLTGEKGYIQRLNAIKRLGTHLTQEDVQGLYDFLDSRFADQGDLDLLSFNAVKNEVLKALLSQDRFPDELGRKLLDMYRDRKHDEVWRDYCVQFFAVYYEKKWPATETGGDVTAAPQVPNDPFRNEIEATYWDALKETKSHIAGTALIGIEHLTRKYPHLDRARVAKTALELATNVKGAVQTRIAAVQTCGLMGMKEVLPTARILAQTGEVTPLRLAAIKVLAQLGGSEDLDLLQGIASASDVYPAKAAEAALKELKGRLAEKK